jgi:hypothetical protein
LHLLIHNLSAFVKFRRKPIRFMVYVKKIKTIMWNALFLESKFIFFTHATWHSICRATTLWAYSTWRFTCNFFIKYFGIYQICISKHTEHMLPGAKTSLPWHSQLCNLQVYKFYYKILKVCKFKNIQSNIHVSHFCVNTYFKVFF